MYLYRYTFEFGEESEPLLRLNKYPVTKRTPKGYYISCRDYKRNWNKPRRVPGYPGVKWYARDTKQAALDDFVRRSEIHVRFLSYRLESVTTILKMIEEKSTSIVDTPDEMQLFDEDATPSKY